MCTQSVVQIIKKPGISFGFESELAMVRKREVLNFILVMLFLVEVCVILSLGCTHRVDVTILRDLSGKK